MSGDDRCCWSHEDYEKDDYTKTGKFYDEPDEENEDFFYPDGEKVVVPLSYEDIILWVSKFIRLDVVWYYVCTGNTSYREYPPGFFVNTETKEIFREPEKQLMISQTPGFRGKEEITSVGSSDGTLLITVRRKSNMTTRVFMVHDLSDMNNINVIYRAEDWSADRECTHADICFDKGRVVIRKIFKFDIDGPEETVTFEAAKGEYFVRDPEKITPFTTDKINKDNFSHRYRLLPKERATLDKYGLLVYVNEMKLDCAEPKYYSENYRKYKKFMKYQRKMIKEFSGSEELADSV